MKQILAKYSNALLLVVAAAFVFTSSAMYIHRPSTPTELLKK